MVRRDPTNTICKMKVFELKQLAKENNILTKYSDGKPKLKCDLMVDTITNIQTKSKSKSKSNRENKSKTEKIFKPTTKITINPRTKKSIKPTKKNLSSIMSMSDDLLMSNENFNIDTSIKQLSDHLNICLTKDYKYKFRSFNEDENKTIKKCYELYKDYDDETNDISILVSIIIYYYIKAKLNSKNPCINELYEIIKIYTNDDAKKMVLLINDSKAIEMAQIRNKISTLYSKNKTKRVTKSMKSKTRRMKKY
jgi:hypothetical protein